MRKIKLIPGLPTKKLIKTIRYHHRHGEASRRALAFYLLDMEQRGEHKSVRCSSTVQFAVDNLDLDPSEARGLLRVARSLEDLPEIDRAFAQGQISWSKLRELTRVATPQTEGEWLSFAKKKRAREVERAASGAKHGQKPPGDGGLGTPRVTFKVQYKLPAALNALWQTAVLKLMDECGKGATPLDALKLMAELAIQKDPSSPINSPGGNVPGRRDRSHPIYTVVYHVAPDGRSAWVEGEEGRVAVPMEIVAEAAQEGRVIEAMDLQNPGDTRAIRFGERGSVPPSERDALTSPELRTRVLARDSNRCAACGSRHEVRVHHLASVANGGKTRIEYLVSLCLTHHSLAHDGLIHLVVDETGRLVVLDGDLNQQPAIPGQQAVIPNQQAPAESSDDLDLVIIEQAIEQADASDQPTIETEEAHASAADDSREFSEAPQVFMPSHSLLQKRSSILETVKSAVPAENRVEIETAPAAPAAAREEHSALSDPSDVDLVIIEEEEASEAEEACASAAADSREFSEAPQVLAPSHSPLSETVHSLETQLANSRLSILQSIESIEDFPAELSAREWQSLAGRLEWSSRRRSYLFRPELGHYSADYPGAYSGAPGRDSHGPRGSQPKTCVVGCEGQAPGLRPARLADVVGQSRVVENLALAAEAALLRGEALGHVLLTGHAGLGKTTLARALASEMGTRLHSAMGPLIAEPSQLIGLLTGLERGDLLFLDEIHRIAVFCEECLYSALEDCVVDVVLAQAQGAHTRPIRIVLPPFTLVGATTALAALAEPFRARFKIEERLEFYSEAEIRAVVERAAPRLRALVSPEACAALARRARGTPREALRLLERARDLAQASARARENASVEARHVVDASERLGIDSEGLRAEERRIMEVLIARGRPMGIDSIAATLRLDPHAVRLVHEPYLVAQGYVVRSFRGREATAKARERLNCLN
jgi:Holliday junction DNA helicase RuvB